MNNIERIKIILIIFIFLLGLNYYINSENLLESMENIEEKKRNKNQENEENEENKGNKGNNNLDKRCSNMLIEHNNKILLFNSNKAAVPGINPITFNDLSEYGEFTKWLKSQNIECPVLYLKYSTDAQNNELLQVKPSIFENNGGVPKEPIVKTKKYYDTNSIQDATKDSNPDKSIKFNSNMYQGFDQQNQNIGLDSPLDQIYHENNKVSANPMDPHWGGKDYTQNKVNSGKYKDRYVYKY